MQQSPRKKLENPSNTPEQPNKPFEAGEKPKEAPEKALDNIVAKTLEPYESRVREAKDYKAANDLTQEACNKLETTLKSNPRLINSLPSDHYKNYDAILVYVPKEGNPIPFSCQVIKEKGGLRVSIRRGSFTSSPVVPSRIGDPGAPDPP